MQQGSSAGAPGTSGSAANAAGATAVLTDEQILGMDPVGIAPSAGTPSAAGLEDSPTGAAPDLSRAASPDAQETAPQAAEADPSQSADARAASARTENEPAWLRALESQPDAAAEARRWRAAASDAAQLDAAYFSADPGARIGLAARLYDTDPGAFRAMLAEGARMLSQRDPQGLAELARQLGATEPAAAQSPSRSLAQAARQDSQPAAQTNPAATFPAEAYREFQAAANDAVGRRVHDAIDNTLRSTLPEGIAEGARRRIGEDIFQEVHTALAGDRDLARQIGDVLSGWRFDAAARQQVTALVSGRARAVLPEVARRVVAEWTSSVLASDRAKSARIAAAASRHDITGGRLPEPVPSSSLRPRDIDYGRLSDEQILAL